MALPLEVVKEMVVVRRSLGEAEGFNNVLGKYSFGMECVIEKICVLYRAVAIIVARSVIFLENTVALRQHKLPHPEAGMLSTKQFYSLRELTFDQALTKKSDLPGKPFPLLAELGRINFPSQCDRLPPEKVAFQIQA